MRFITRSSVAAGCGGGESGGQQDSKQRTSQAKNGGSGNQGGNAPQAKIAVGKILAVNTEGRRFVLKPSKGDPIKFKALPKAKIELDGKEVDLASMKKDQNAQVRYVVKDTGVKERAQVITLFSKEGPGGTTG
ncbi:MAG: hypothetical protein WA990_00840 [Rubrobacteraceae bacterium]